MSFFFAEANCAPLTIRGMKTSTRTTTTRTCPAIARLWSLPARIARVPGKTDAVARVTSMESVRSEREREARPLGERFFRVQEEKQKR
jgi:hypothetical protein